MPSGLTHSCPFEEGSSLPAQSGSLSGTVIFSFGCIGVFVACLFAGRGALGRTGAAGLCLLYAAYAAYQILAQRSLLPAVCVGGICI